MTPYTVPKIRTAQQGDKKDKQLLSAGFPQLLCQLKIKNPPEGSHNNAGQNGDRQVF